MTDYSKIHPASLEFTTKNRLQSYLSIIVCFVILESFWLGYVQKDNWRQQIIDIQGSEPQYRTSSAIFAYIVMFIAVVVFGINNVRKDYLIKDSLYYGGLIGLVMYGVFNGTNYAIFKGYKFETFVSDLCWGIFLCFITTLIGAYFLYN